MVLVAGDVVAFLAARAALAAIRDGAVLGPAAAAAADWAIPRGAFAGWQLLSALVVGLLLAGAYGKGDCRRDPRRILAGVFLAASLTLWGPLWVRGVPQVPVQFVVTVLGLWGLVVVMRFVIDRAVSRYWVRLQAGERVVFVGDPNHPTAVSLCVRLARTERMEMVGWVTPPVEDGPLSGNGNAAALGTGDNLWSILEHLDVDTVVICGNVSDRLFGVIVEATTAAGCRLLLVSRTAGAGRARPSPVRYHGLPFVQLTPAAHRAERHRRQAVSIGLG